MNKSVLIGLIVLLVLGAIGYSMLRPSNPEKVSDLPATSPTPLVAAVINNDETFALAEQNDSKQDGEVTFIDEDGKTRVILQLNNAPAGVSQPAHIHAGACPAPGAVKYPLTSVVDGKSDTLLNVSMEQLESEQPLAVNIHKSQAEVSVYVSCGDMNL